MCSLPTSFKLSKIEIGNQTGHELLKQIVIFKPCMNDMRCCLFILDKDLGNFVLFIFNQCGDVRELEEKLKSLEANYTEEVQEKYLK